MKYCLLCGKELTKWQSKFCCSSCAAKYNNKGKTHSESSKKKVSESLKKFYKQHKKEHFSQADKNKFVCSICGKEFESYKNDRKFCSNKCLQEYYYRVRTEAWLNGKECNSEKLPEFIRRFLHEKHDSKCQICGWGKENPHTHKIPLQVHHIDGDCTNNKEENLQLLCPNCHSLTETFGSNNKDSKRYKLKEYKETLAKNRLSKIINNLKNEDKEEILNLLK